MAFSTPPSSVGKRNSFMEPCNKLVYYEDLCGEPNEDEEFDRFPDACEESSSEDEAKRSSKKRDIPTSLFRSIATPKRRVPSSALGYHRFREVSITRKRTQNFFGQFISRQSGTADNTKPSFFTTPNAFEVTKETERALQNSSARDEGSPTISRDNSISFSRKKMLTPKKFGMFTSPTGTPTREDDYEESGPTVLLETPGTSFDTAMEHGEGASNTAGEAMDDLLRSGALADLDDIFPTLDEDVDSSEDVTKAADCDQVLSTPGVQSAFDGDVEDNTSETSNNADKEEEEISKGDEGKSIDSVIVVHKDKVRKPAALPNPRRSKRQEEIEKAKKAAENQTGRRATCTQDSKAKAAELMARNHSKMTARAANLRTKAQRNGTKTQPGKDKAAYTTKNWAGEKINANGGVVVVRTDETNVEDYVRY